MPTGTVPLSRQIRMIVRSRVGMKIPIRVVPQKLMII